MTGKKASFSPEKLKTVFEKEIESRSAKYWSDQVLATHKTGEKLKIAKYINNEEIEEMLEGVISQLGGGPLEQGMVFVSITDKDGRIVTSDSDCDKVILSVAYGQNVICQKRAYPLPEKSFSAASPPSTPEPTELNHNAPKKPSQGKAESEKASLPAGPTQTKTGHSGAAIKAKQRHLSKELKRKLDELWTNRKGLGVDFNNPGALKIELVEDSPRITKIVQEIGEEELEIKIDKENNLIKVVAGGKIYLKWEFPKDEVI